MQLTPDPTPGEARSRRPLIRRIITILGLWGIVTLLVFAIIGGGTKGGPEEGSDAVMMQVPLLGAAAPFDMGSLKGKTVLLDFWATHCGPCKRTLPALQKVHERYKDDPSVAIMSVNLDHGRDRDALVRRYMDHYTLNFPVLMDSGALSNAYNVQFIPLLVVIDPNGKVMKSEVGLKGEDTGAIAAQLVATVEQVRE